MPPKPASLSPRGKPVPGGKISLLWRQDEAQEAAQLRTLILSVSGTTEDTFVCVLDRKSVV